MRKRPKIRGGRKVPFTLDPDNPKAGILGEQLETAMKAVEIQRRLASVESIPGRPIDKKYIFYYGDYRPEGSESWDDVVDYQFLQNEDILLFWNQEGDYDLMRSVLKQIESYKESGVTFHWDEETEAAASEWKPRED